MRRARTPKPPRSDSEILASLSCTIGEAAQVVGVSRDSLMGMIAEGELHTFPVGSRVRVAVPSIYRLVGKEWTAPPAKFPEYRIAALEEPKPEPTPAPVSAPPVLATLRPQPNDRRVFLDPLREEAWTTARAVAEAFEKEHKHVLRDVDRLLADAEKDRSKFGPISIASYFEEDTYEDSYGRPQRTVRISESGFMLLAMGFEGAKALRTKVEFLEEFKRMRGELAGRSRLPQPTRQKLGRILADRIPEADWEAFFVAWWREFGTQMVTTGELLAMADANGMFADLYTYTETPIGRIGNFGRAMTSRLNRSYGGIVGFKAKVMSGTTFYRLRKDE